MTYDFESLSCPMCGGELIYSEGTHDLCCAKNKYELSSMEMGRGGPSTAHCVRAQGERGISAMPGRERRKDEIPDRVRDDKEERDKFGDRGERSAAMPAGIKSGDRGERFSAMPAGIKSGDGGERSAAMPGNELNKIGRALHEPGAGYGSAGSNGETQGESSAPNSGSTQETHVGMSRPHASKSDLNKSSGCLFAVSFTESGRHGTLWSIRTVHGGTNYFSLMRLMDKIEKRQRRGEPLAANVPNLPRKVERSKECKLAFRYSLEVEDLYSIKYSSETVDKLAMYYGLTEPDIRHIQAAEIGGDQGT